MKKILTIVFSNLKHDARVKRQIDFLKKDYQLTIVCFDAEPSNEFEIIKLKKTKLSLIRKAISALFLFFGFFKKGHGLIHDYEYIKNDLIQRNFDIVIANDVETLPLAFDISKSIFLDAHEYAPLHFEDRLWWRIFFKRLNLYLCSYYIPQLLGMTTIGRGLANEYEKHFKVKPIIITNATNYYKIEPSIVANNQIRLVHHGIANPSRKIELMIEMMQYLDESYTLDMILMTSDFASTKTKIYIESIKQLIHADPRIKILPPVSSHQVVATLNPYDIGVFLIPPVNFNYANTLPNKLFEYIQARLAIAVGPTPEMASIVNKYNNGVVSDDFTAKALAEKIQLLNIEKIRQFKMNSAIAANELCAENNKEIFRKYINEILKR